MEKHLIRPDFNQFPPQLHPLLTDAPVYDSSSSPQARVWFIDRDGGYYLKHAAKNALRREADLTRYFHQKGLAAEVLAYDSAESDWLLTAAVPGEDCVSARCLAEPARLCDTLAAILHELHAIDPSDCPFLHTEAYLETAEHNYRAGMFDPAHIPEAAVYPHADAAWQTIQQKKHLLRSDTLIHGDFCLPNIILQDWKLRALIDFDHAGIGDRHVDLFWALWSLRFNLKTDRYAARFLDAYGRDRVDPEVLQLIAAIEVFG